jgi:hypothetical protein
MSDPTDPKTFDPNAGVADALLNLWREQLETPEGREVLAGILCRTMGAVVGEGCVKVCPMAGQHGQDVAMRKAVSELIVQLDFAREHADAVQARVTA